MHNISRMMFIFIILNTVLFVQSAPTSDDLHIPVYDKLLEYSKKKCPYLKTTKLLTPKPLSLNSCSEFSNIKSITSLTRETQYYTPCLFYYNNFIALCNINVDFETIVNNDSINIALKSYNLTNSCNLLQNIQLIQELDGAKGMLDDFKKPQRCERICSEVDTITVTPLCSLAAYILNVSNSLQSIPTKISLNSATASEQVQNITAAKQKPPPTKSQPAQIVQSAALQSNQKSVELVSKVNSTKVKPQDTSSKKTLPLVNLFPRPTELKIKENDQVLSDATSKENVHTDHKPEDTEPSDLAQKEKIKPGEEKELQGDQQKAAVLSPQVDVKLDNQPIVSVDQEKPPLAHEENGDIAQTTKEQKEEDKQKPKGDTENETGETPSEVAQPIKDADNPLNNPALQDKGETIQAEEDPNEEGVQQNSEEFSETDADEQNQESQKSPETASKQTNAKPKETDEDVMVPAFNDPNTDEEDSFFFIYFMMVCAVFILGYIGYHNKQKVLALVIEGRRGRRGSRRGRPNSANYHKLDSNLEEAVTSSCNKNTTNIIY